MEFFKKRHTLLSIHTYVGWKFINYHITTGIRYQYGTLYKLSGAPSSPVTVLQYHCAAKIIMKTRKEIRRQMYSGIRYAITC